MRQETYVFKPFVDWFFVRQQAAKNQHLSSTFFDTMLGFASNPEADYWERSTEIDSSGYTRQIVGFNEDRYQQVVAAVSRKELSAIQQDGRVTAQTLWALYAYLVSFIEFLQNNSDSYVSPLGETLSMFAWMNMEYEQNHARFNRWERKHNAPGSLDFDDIPLSVIPAVTQRVIDFMSHMASTIKAVLPVKPDTVDVSQYQFTARDFTGFMDAVNEKMAAKVRESAEFLKRRARVTSSPQKKRPWNKPSFANYVNPILTRHTPRQSLLDAWKSLSVSRKLLLSGFLLLGVAAIVAGAVFVPGSEVITLPLLGVITADLLTMLSGAVVASAAVSATAMTLFAHRHAKSAGVGQPGIVAASAA